MIRHLVQDKILYTIIIHYQFIYCIQAICCEVHFTVKIIVYYFVFVIFSNVHLFALMYNKSIVNVSYIIHKSYKL